MEKKKYSSLDEKSIFVSLLNSPPQKKRRFNTASEVGSPFETPNVAHAHVSCIAINNVDTDCFIDNDVIIYFRY